MLPTNLRQLRQCLLRRAFAALGLATAVILSAASCGDGEPVTGPNVLLVSIDTLRADHVGFYGYDRPTSPRLDSFAETATVFDRAQASASWTLPGMATIFTSTYTSTHGCWDYGGRLDDSFTTLTEVLTANGYDTACVVSHLYCTTRYGLQQGFVHFDDSFALPDIDPELATTSHLISDKGVRFIEQKHASPDERPWFLWLHYFDPHDEYMFQEGFSEKLATPGDRTPRQTIVDLYDGEIAYTDHHVGRVLDALNESRFGEDTIVVLVTDHGEEFQDHGGDKHGHTLFSELVRVPFAIRAPGLAPSRVTDLVRTIDLMPTVLDLAGLPVPHLAVGTSLVDSMKGAPVGPLTAFSELRLNGDHRLESISSGGYKLIYGLDDGSIQLFDTDADPEETNDLSRELPDVVLQLSEELETQRSRAEDLGARYDVAPPTDLPPSITDALGKLGYLGDEEDEDL
jgi:arylsulfatase A-like enzyme